MAPALHQTYTVENRAELKGLHGAVAYSVDGAWGQDTRGVLLAVFLPRNHPLAILDESLYHAFFNDSDTVAAAANIFPSAPDGVAPNARGDWVVWGVLTVFQPGVRSKSEALYLQTLNLRHLLSVAVEIRDLQTVGAVTVFTRAMTAHLEYLEALIRRDRRRGTP